MDLFVRPVEKGTLGGRRDELRATLILTMAGVTQLRKAAASMLRMNPAKPLSGGYHPKTSTREAEC
ncbi:hypothetical protein [Amycolatopsis albispora]|uniref:hypothetical protein n=1 Tax=Amycolatopsis albispora TaxID=1804986 RepID=UPI0013B3B74C|nr:hypothetical protein [Amycolatopsis albispora]